MEVIKKNGFWIICGIAALMMIGVFFWQSLSLSEAQKANEQKIDSSASTAKAIKSKTVELNAQEAAEVPSAHPNRATVEGMTDEIGKAADALVRSWDIRYNAQQKIMQWPEEVQKNADFVATFKKFNPPEKYDQGAVDQPNSLLMIYKSSIPSRMEKLCDRFRTQWNAAKKSEDAAASAKPPVVMWDDKNQKLWEEKLTNFKKEGNRKDVPTTFQVFAVQQDLWLLEAVFGVIEKVNGAASANDLAPVKKIDHIVFGRDTLAASGGLSALNSLLVNSTVAAQSADGAGKAGMAAPGGESEEGGGGGSVGAMSGGGRQSMGSIDGAAASGAPPGMEMLTPFDKRYVDADLKPIPIADLQAALKGTELPETNLESIIAKRVPFRVALRMNEKKIPEMIAAFGTPSRRILGSEQDGAETNDFDYSGFNFEVMQVRVNRSDEYGDFGDTASSGQPDGGGGGNSKGPGGGKQGGIGAMDFDEDAGSRGNVPGSELGEDTAVPREIIELRKNFDVDVEFYGIVKIYNPVDAKRFKGESADVANENSGANPGDSQTSQLGGNPTDNSSS